MTRSVSSRVTGDPFVPGERFRIPQTGSGTLDGMSFAVKDLIDVAGRSTGGGNPDWRGNARLAPDHAPAVKVLLSAGAYCVGKTITDEFAFSLEGDNHHYGIPANPRCADCLPGGSSSGSAVAVASGLCDFALGTDTGGSVRVPAAFCGVYGLRPGHGTVSSDGTIPFAPSYDTVGWMADRADIMAAVGEALLPSGPAGSIENLLLCVDALPLVEETLAEDLLVQAGKLGASRTIRLFDQFAFDELSGAYQAIQGHEIASTLWPEIKRISPELGPTIADRFAAACRIGSTKYETACALRHEFASWIGEEIPSGTGILLPVSPVATLPAGVPVPDTFYPIALGLNSVAGHAGLPQLQLPPLTGSRLGFSVIAGPGGEHALLALAQALSADREF